MAVFAKMGSKFYFLFIFKTPKGHIVEGNRIFWRILRDDQCGGLGCRLAEEPKNEYLGVIFQSFGEKKHPGLIWTKFYTSGDIT